MQETSIPRIDVADRAAFDAHVANETPCVIAGGARDWRATRRWSVAYLTELVGAVPVRYKASSSHVHPDFRATELRDMFATGACTLGELLATMTTGDVAARARRLFTGDEQWLVRRRDGVTTVHEPLRALLDDVAIPDRFAADRLYTIWAWFSGSGVRTWLHYDNNGCHNLNAQLAGEKECVLFPPSELARLAPFPIGGPNPAVNCSQIDLEHPERYPELAGAKRLVGRLETGDLLMIPAWWFHAFVHVGEFNANVNFWWKPEQLRANPVAERESTRDSRV